MDHLTRIDTRGVLLEKITEEHKRYLRYKRPYSIIIIDIDHFKNINDHHGHLAGDAVLRTLSELIKNHLRTSDAFGRYGGEEFIILLPETALKEAVLVAENIRQLIQNHDFPGPEKITISMGVAETHPAILEIDELIEKADKCLYQAKATGRNKVCFDISISGMNGE
jgi:diguanylate cyclase (GGDEF)-like protein